MDRRKKGSGQITYVSGRKSPWRACVVDSTGKQKSRFFKTEKEAKAFLREVNADANKLKSLLETGVSLRAFSEIFLQEKAKENMKPTAYKTLELNIGRVCDKLGHVMLRDIDSDMVQQLVFDLGKEGYFGILQAEQPVYRPVVVKSPRVLDAPDAQKYSGKYAIPIVQLKGLSIRGYHCLYRAGLHYVGDLVKMPGDDWLRVRNLGRSILEEIAAAVSNLGLAINMPSRPDAIKRTDKSTDYAPISEDKPVTTFEEPHPVGVINKNRETPLLELDLPQYIQFALLQRGVETAGDIADLTPFVWKQMKQLKQSDQTLVAEKLKELGLRIKK